MLAFTIPPLLLPARESTIVICNCCCLLPSWFPLSLIWLEAWGSMIDIRVVCWGFPLLENSSCFLGTQLSSPFHSLWFVWVLGLLSEEEKLLWFCGHWAGCTICRTHDTMQSVEHFYSQFASIMKDSHYHLYIFTFRSTRTCMYYISRFSDPCHNILILKQSFFQFCWHWRTDVLMVYVKYMLAPCWWPIYQETQFRWCHDSLKGNDLPLEGLNRSCSISKFAQIHIYTITEMIIG